MQQSQALMHYGVKGMKWGVRRKRSAPESSPERKKQYKPTESDKLLFGEKGAQRIADRRNKGVSYSKARGREAVRQVATGIGVSTAAVLASYAISSGEISKLGKIGKNVVDSYLNTSILDRNGSVIRRYHNSVRVGEAFVTSMIKR